MASIPTDLADWFSVIPWYFTGMTFHDYWSEVNDGKRGVDNFLIFDQGTRNKYSGGTHEMAHLIVCADEHIMDPYFGSPPVKDPYKELSDEFWLSEIEVMYVGDVIDCWEHANTWYTDFNYPSFDTVMAFLGRRKHLHDRAMQLYQRARSKWKLKDIWNELERKKVLVTQALS